LRSWITDDGPERPYQQGMLAGLLPPDELLARARPRLDDGSLMFCGTCGTQGGIRPAALFRYELEDPVLGRTIGSSYTVQRLPLVS
jgi:hypothetical protein